MKLAVVHDLAEALAGDIAPFQNVSKEDKRRLEQDGLEKICSTIGSEPIGGCVGGRRDWAPTLSPNLSFLCSGGLGDIEAAFGSTHCSWQKARIAGQTTAGVRTQNLLYASCTATYQVQHYEYCSCTCTVRVP